MFGPGWQCCPAFVNFGNCSLTDRGNPSIRTTIYPGISTILTSIKNKSQIKLSQSTTKLIKLQGGRIFS